MAGEDSEREGLRELVRRDRQELDELRRELEEIGRELRAEHVRRMKTDRVTAMGEQRPVNRICAGCLCSCKQPDTVRIYRCAKYEPVE